MLKTRVWNIMLGATLAAQAGLTVHQAVATSQVVSAGAATVSQPAANLAFPNCPWTDTERHTMQLEYVKSTNRWELGINHQPLGFDGGLSALRDCPPLNH